MKIKNYECYRHKNVSKTINKNHPSRVQRIFFHCNGITDYFKGKHMHLSSKLEILVHQITSGLLLK